MNKNIKMVAIVLVVALGVVFGVSVDAYASRGGGTQIGFSLDNNTGE